MAEDGDGVVGEQEGGIRARPEKFSKERDVLAERLEDRRSIPLVT